MATVAEKLRKARESTVEVGGFEWIIRRPTDLEAMRLRSSTKLDELIPHIVGWNKVREMDVLPTGDGHPLAYDPEVCREWLVDRIDLLNELVLKISAAYKAHRAAMEAAEKN
jgi:hypothetical protein